MKKPLMIIRILILCIFLPAFIACTHEEIEGVDSSALSSNQFRASFSEDGTKVTMDADYNLFWEKDDEVSVFDEDGNNLLFKAKDAAASTVLEGDVEVDGAKTYYAAIPYSVLNEMEGTSISLSIPPVQTPRAGSFPANYAVAKSEGKTFRFYNVCGLYITFFQKKVTTVYKISPEVYE